jgi:23S rRNA (uridine2552-2'-O)-methyltransferase
MSPFNTKDHYFQMAKTEGFKARSVYKLMEMDRSLKLLKPGQCVLDLGCAPGSWLQYVAQKIGSKGIALGVDLTPIKDKLAPNVVTAELDVFNLSPEAASELLNRPQIKFDVVLSDMAPKTTGIKHMDQTRSVDLAVKAKNVALDMLKPGGSVIIKVFNGGEVPGLVNELKKSFTLVRQMRPPSIRTASKEFYVVGLKKK